MTSSTITIRLDDKLKARLEQLSNATHRSKSFLAVEAIVEYLKIQEWQIKEIKNGLAEADAGYMVEHENIVNHWQKKRVHSLDKGRR